MNNIFTFLVPCEKNLVDEEAFVSERISALNVPLIALDPTIQNVDDEEMEIDQFSKVK